MATEHLTRQFDLIPMSALNEKITIIGAGAIGSFTALSLAKMGFHKIEVWDADVVSVENMNSQFYRFQDIDKPKVVALRDLIKDFTGIEIKTRFEFYEAGPLEGIVISAVDSMSARKLVWENQFMKNISCKILIDPRMGAETAMVFTADPKDFSESGKYANSLYDDADAVHERCTAKATMYTATMLSGLIAKMVKDVVTIGKTIKTVQWSIKDDDFVAHKPPDRVEPRTTGFREQSIYLGPLPAFDLTTLDDDDDDAFEHQSALNDIREHVFEENVEIGYFDEDAAFPDIEGRLPSRFEGNTQSGESLWEMIELAGLGYEASQWFFNACWYETDSCKLFFDDGTVNLFFDDQNVEEIFETVNFNYQGSTLEQLLNQTAPFAEQITDESDFVSILDTSHDAAPYSISFSNSAGGGLFNLAGTGGGGGGGGSGVVESGAVLSLEALEEARRMIRSDLPPPPEELPSADLMHNHIELCRSLEIEFSVDRDLYSPSGFRYRYANRHGQRTSPRLLDAHELRQWVDSLEPIRTHDGTGISISSGTREYASVPTRTVSFWGP